MMPLCGRRSSSPASTTRCSRRPGARRSPCSSALGHEVDFPRGADVLRADARQHRLPRTRRCALVRRFVRVFGDAEAVVSPSASCAAMVRERYERMAAEAGDEALAAQVATWRRACSSCRSSSSSGSGVEDVGASFPHRVTYHPTCHSLRLLKVGDAPLRLLRAVRGIDLVELPRRRAVLRLRRHVRGQERRHLDGDAHRQVRRDPRHGRRGLHGGRQLVPDAHRRRPAPRARRRARDAPGRDPGHGATREATASPRPRARALADSQLRRNLRHATTTIRAKRARRGRRGARLGGAARRGRGDQGRARCATSTSTSSASRRPSRRAGGTVHWARDAAEANRDRRRRRARARRRRGHQGQVAGHRRDRPQRRARGRAACTRVETDLAELIIQLGDDTSSHILVPAIHRNRAEIRDALPRATLGRRGLATSPRELAEAARAHLREQVPARRRSASAARTSRVAETGTSCVRRVRGQRAHVHDAARGAHHRDGHREAPAALGATSRSCSSCCRARRPASG